ncbi:MAG: alcohol dehydrogenase catalytic domain-containing protein [Pseudomonadota bacterium]
MKALFFDGSNLGLKEMSRPVIRNGESLVRIILAGICKTDLEILKGYMNFRGVLGHEFVGQVIESDDLSLFGKRVVGEINAGCGKCDFCRKGLERHCPDRTTLGIFGRDGVFAEFVALPTSNLIAVPENVTDEMAVFTEPLAAALEITEQVHLDPNSKVLIIGDGRLSALIFLALRLTGADITVLGKHDSKLDVFETLGAKTCRFEQTGTFNRNFDIVVESSGSPSGWVAATRFVKPRGLIILKSTYHGNLEINAAELVINEICVQGSRCGRFTPALRLMESGLVDPSFLISGSWPLDSYEEAFRKAGSPGMFKTLLRI